jgi:uncharacterized protein YjbI with pentapeptide repeats
LPTGGGGMNIEIKSRYSGLIIIVGEYDSIIDVVEKNKSNLRGADLQGANLYEASLRGADLREANLQGASLRGADLREANLYEASLRGADLREANLRGANLYGADLRGYLYLKGSRNDIQYYKNSIIIGCEEHDVDYWIVNYREIGNKHNYTREQIGEYYNYIMVIKQFKELEKEDKK